MSTQDLTNTIAEAVAEAWSTLFMKTVGLTPGAMTTLEDNEDTPVGTYVSCDIAFSGDISGSARFVVGKIEALTMVGMMMSMGADDALIDSTREGELGAEELDALKEAFNQLTATAATILRDQLGCTVNTDMGEVESVELMGALEGFGDGDQAITMGLSLEGYDDGSLFQIVSADLHQALDSAESPAGEDAPAESAPATAPEAAQAPGSQVDLDAIGHLSVSADLILAERVMDVNNLLTLAVGSVIEFWKPCDHPADLCIQNTPIANGEVVLCQNQHFGLRVLNLAPPRQIYNKGSL